MTRDARVGLPEALLTKWQTPFDHTLDKLRTFLPLKPYPDHVTEEKCVKLHSIFKEGIDKTDELTSVIAQKITTLQRKRARPPPSGREQGSSQQDNILAKDSEGVSKMSLSKMSNKKHKDRSTAGDSSSSKKRKSGVGSGRDDRRSPAWTSRTPRVGEQVAAKADEEGQWFLARVEKHLAMQNLFVVADDNAGSGRRRQYKLPRSNVLALPRREEASGASFAKGSEVMTLYPNTTNFYPATIVEHYIEGKNGEPDYCVAQFQEDELTHDGIPPSHKVPAHVVRPRT